MADFLQDHLGPARERVDEHLDRFFTEIRDEDGLGLVPDDEAGRVLPSEREFIGELEEYVLRGGKRLRPVSLFWAYKAAGGEGGMDDIYPVHLTVELFHNGTLVHDDFADQDPTRRGGPSIHQRAIDRFDGMVPRGIGDYVREVVDAIREDGIDGLPRRVMAASGTAIDAGNVMENLSREAVHRADRPAAEQMAVLETMNRNASLVNFGQNLDLKMEQLSIQDIARRDGVYDGGLVGRAADRLRGGANGVYDELMDEFDSWTDAYINMIDKKTVDLYLASVDIGAQLADASRSQRETLRTAMRDIGRAFQIQDDYLEIEESAADIGKEPTDIRNGKLTLAAITTYETLNAGIDLLERGPDAFDTRAIVDRYVARDGVAESQAVEEVHRATRGDASAIGTLHEAGIELTDHATTGVRYLDDAVLERGADRLKRDRDRFLSLYGDVSDEEDVQRVSDIILDYGTAKEWATGYIRSAKEALRGSDLEETYRAKFEGLADFMLDRTH